MSPIRSPVVGGVDHEADLVAWAKEHQAKRWRLESMVGDQATLIAGRPVNHVLHLLLSVLTLGVWALFVWLPLGIFGGEQRLLLSFDVDGRPRARRV
jgi:hypothetical protein